MSQTPEQAQPWADWESQQNFLAILAASPLSSLQPSPPFEIVLSQSSSGDADDVEQNEAVHAIVNTGKKRKRLDSKSESSSSSSSSVRLPTKRLRVTIEVKLVASSPASAPESQESA